MEKYKNHPLYRRHNIDSAMSSLWDFYKSRFFTLFIISFGISLIIQIASSLIDISELQTITDPMLMIEKLKDLLLPLLVISILGLLFSAMFQYFVIFNPIDSENNFIVSAIRSLKYFIPYLVVMLILAITGSRAMVLGLMVFIIGLFFSLLYIITVYLFILPVMMIENTNIPDTIRRSLTLTHKNFWSNIGWVAVFLIILVIVSVILSALVLIPFTGGFLRAVMNPEEITESINITSSPLFIILSSAVNALTYPLPLILSCILYFNGKAGEEQDFPIRSDMPENDVVKVEDLYAKPLSDNQPDKS